MRRVRLGRHAAYIILTMVISIVPTVNTAARMEQNGMRGRIHVSQTTAEALNKAGKGNWLTQREDKIEAKGKGKLTTYFVTITPGKAGTEMSGSQQSWPDPTEHTVIGGTYAADADVTDATFEAQEWV